MLSWEQVGSAAILSRATAGVARGKIVVSVPGSQAAVELAKQKLLQPELGHMVDLVHG
jgi:molybdenum cofactor biosynthesis protein B